MMKVPKVRRMDMVVRLMWMRLAKWNKGESGGAKKEGGGLSLSEARGLTFAVALHARGGVDGVTKEAVSRHFYSHYTCTDRT